jgi:hypothetical protein
VLPRPGRSAGPPLRLRSLRASLARLRPWPTRRSGSSLRLGRSSLPSSLRLRTRRSVSVVQWQV